MTVPIDPSPLSHGLPLKADSVLNPEVRAIRDFICFDLPCRVTTRRSPPRPLLLRGAGVEDEPVDRGLDETGPGGGVGAEGGPPPLGGGDVRDGARPGPRPGTAAVQLGEGLVPAPASNEAGITPDGRRMLEAIDNLPEDEREVFGVVRLQGLTHVEAAEVLDVSVKTVQRRVNRASLLLAEELDDLRPT